MTRVASWGPNGLDGIHVHKPGCADTKRGTYRNQFVDPPWEIDVTSVKHLVEEHYGPQAGSFYEESGYVPGTPEYDAAWRDYLGEFRIFPCVTLPEEDAPEVPEVEWTVEWYIDGVPAASPLAAAREALAIHRDPESIATAFVVSADVPNGDGTITPRQYLVDLHEGTVTEKEG